MKSKGLHILYYSLNVKVSVMPKVSSKRQITLPSKQCEVLGIDPGDEVEVFIADGQLTVVKKRHGAAKGVLKHVKGDPAYSDDDSRDASVS